jgi:hypothetical protein
VRNVSGSPAFRSAGRMIFALKVSRLIGHPSLLTNKWSSGAGWTAVPASTATSLRHDRRARAARRVRRGSPHFRRPPREHPVRTRRAVPRTGRPSHAGPPRPASCRCCSSLPRGWCPSGAANRHPLSTHPRREYPHTPPASGKSRTVSPTTACASCSTPAGPTGSYSPPSHSAGIP